MNIHASPFPRLIACALLAVGCAEAPNDDAHLRVVLHTPAPEELASPHVTAPIDDIRIRFDRIDLHAADGAWISVDPYDEEDYEVYFGEMPLVLADADLPRGEYDQLRLIVVDAEIFVAGSAYSLEIPSGETSGFKIHGDFCIHAHDDDDDVNELHLRWDVDQGVRHSDTRGYWLVPSVQIHSTSGCEDHEHDDNGG
jgi:hypothetical protein